jgi:hypothetical protein
MAYTTTHSIFNHTRVAGAMATLMVLKLYWFYTTKHGHYSSQYIICGAIIPSLCTFVKFFKNYMALRAEMTQIIYHVECNRDLSKNSYMQSIRCLIHTVVDSVSISNPFSPFYYLW